MTGAWQQIRNRARASLQRQGMGTPVWQPDRAVCVPACPRSRPPLALRQGRPLLSSVPKHTLAHQERRERELQPAGLARIASAALTVATSWASRPTAAAKAAELCRRRGAGDRPGERRARPRAGGVRSMQPKRQRAARCAAATAGTAAWPCVDPHCLPQG